MNFNKAYRKSLTATPRWKTIDGIIRYCLAWVNWAVFAKALLWSNHLTFSMSHSNHWWIIPFLVSAILSGIACIVGLLVAGNLFDGSTRADCGEDWGLLGYLNPLYWVWRHAIWPIWARTTCRFDTSNPSSVLMLTDYLEKGVKEKHEAITNAIRTNRKATLSATQELQSILTELNHSDAEQTSLGEIRRMQVEAILKQLAELQDTLADQESRSDQELKKVTDVCDRLRIQNRTASQIQAIQQAMKILIRVSGEIPIIERQLTELANLSFRVTDALTAIGQESESAKRACIELNYSPETQQVYGSVR